MVRFRDSTSFSRYYRCNSLSHQSAIPKKNTGVILVKSLQLYLVGFSIFNFFALLVFQKSKAGGQRFSPRKNALKIYANSKGNHLYLSVFCNNVVGCRPPILSKRDTGTFLLIFQKFSEQLFIEHLQSTKMPFLFPSIFDFNELTLRNFLTDICWKTKSLCFLCVVILRLVTDVPEELFFTRCFFNKSKNGNGLESFRLLVKKSIHFLKVKKQCHIIVKSNS